MKDVDFSVCPFIKNELCFLTYFDFCKNAKILKIIYEGLETNAKIFYKFYVYANIHMTEYFKDRIWEYLNGGEEQYIELIDNIRKYRVK